MVNPYPRQDGGFRRSERNMDEDLYSRSQKPAQLPSQPPPGAVPPNPNVAKYQEYVEKHIDRCAALLTIKLTSTSFGLSKIELNLNYFFVEVQKLLSVEIWRRFSLEVRNKRI